MCTKNRWWKVLSPTIDSAEFPDDCDQSCLAKIIFDNSNNKQLLLAQIYSKEEVPNAYPASQFNIL